MSHPMRSCVEFSTCGIILVFKKFLGTPWIFGFGMFYPYFNAFDRSLLIRGGGQKENYRFWHFSLLKWQTVPSGFQVWIHSQTFPQTFIERNAWERSQHHPLSDLSQFPLKVFWSWPQIFLLGSLALPQTQGISKSPRINMIRVPRLLKADHQSKSVGYAPRCTAWASATDQASPQHACKEETEWLSPSLLSDWESQKLKESFRILLTRRNSCPPQSIRNASQQHQENLNSIQVDIHC